jgi:hypothetical protein
MGAVTVSKQTGLGDNFYVAGYDLSGDIGAIDGISAPMSPLEITGILKSAPERTGGKRDGALDFSAWFNKAAGAAHLRLSPLPTADVIATYCRGTTLGNPGAAMVGKQIDYAGTRGDDGSFTFKIQAQANAYGLEWGRQLTAGKRTDTAATNGTSVDLGAASPGAFGLQAYLHIFSFTGTSCTVTIQESSDNGVGDAFAAVVGGAFTAATGITSQRIATAAINVERYLRVVTTGTFSECTFAVTAVRNDTSVTF